MMVRVGLVSLLCCGVLYPNISDASSASNSDTMQVIATYILNDIVEQPSGAINAPTTSESGRYQVSWYFEQVGDSYVLEQRQINRLSSTWQALYQGTQREVSVVNEQNGQYVYRVKTCAAGQCSAYIESGITQVSQAADGPVNVIASHTSGVNTVSWTDNAVNSQQASQPRYTGAYVQSTSANSDVVYQVEESVNGFAYQKIGETSARNFQHQVSDEFSRQYQIRTCSNAQCSKPSAPSNLVNGLLPPDVSTTNGANVSVHWQAVAGAEYYRVKISIDGGNWLVVSVTDALSFNYIQGYDGDVKFSVQACDKDGCYGDSNQTQVFSTENTLVCQNIKDRLTIGNLVDDYFIGYIDKTTNTKVFPGVVDAFETSEQIQVARYWRLANSASEWTLSPISAITFNQSNSGGLALACRSTSATTGQIELYSDKQNKRYVLNAAFDNHQLTLTPVNAYADVYSNGTNLYIKVQGASGEIYLALSGFSGENPVFEQLDVLSWNALAPENNAWFTNYKVVSGQFNGDNLTDFKVIIGDTEFTFVQSEPGVYALFNNARIIFIHTDILGSPVAETDQAGNVL